MAVLLDSYSESNKDANGSVYSGGPQGTQIGQSFTAPQTINAYSAKFYLQKVGAPTGTISALLAAHAGVFGTSSEPTGAVLIQGDLDVSTITTGSYNLYEFLFSGTYELQSGTNYVVVIEYTGGDGSNYVDVGVDVSSPTHGGNIWDAAGGPDSGVDCIFFIYGQDATSPKRTLMGVGS